MKEGYFIALYRHFILAPLLLFVSKIISFVYDIYTKATMLRKKAIEKYSNNPELYLKKYKKVFFMQVRRGKISIARCYLLMKSKETDMNAAEYLCDTIKDQNTLDLFLKTKNKYKTAVELYEDDKISLDEYINNIYKITAS